LASEIVVHLPRIAWIANVINEFRLIPRAHAASIIDIEYKSLSAVSHHALNAIVIIAYRARYTPLARKAEVVRNKATYARFAVPKRCFASANANTALSLIATTVAVLVVSFLATVRDLAKEKSSRTTYALFVAHIVVRCLVPTLLTASTHNIRPVLWAGARRSSTNVILCILVNEPLGGRQA